MRFAPVIYSPGANRLPSTVGSGPYIPYFFRTSCIPAAGARLIIFMLPEHTIGLPIEGPWQSVRVNFALSIITCHVHR